MIEVGDLLGTLEGQLLFSLIVAGTALGSAYLVSRIRRRLNERVRPLVVDLLSSVVYVGIVIGMILIIADIWDQTDTLVDQMGFLRFDERAPAVIITIVVLVAIQVLIGIAARLLDDLTTDSHALTEHQREMGLRFTQVSLWGAGVIVILGVWEIDLTGLLVGAGFLGIVVGLAARQTIGSLLAGFTLMFSRPFEVGDWIAIDDFEGVVSDITMMSTRLRAFNGEYIVIPNDVVSSKTVINRTREGQFRVDVEVGIDYDADVEHARDVAATTANELTNQRGEVLQSPDPDVWIRHLDDSAVVLSVRVWIDAPTIRRVNQIRDDLITAIKENFDQEGIKIPYPQRELSGRSETGGLQIEQGERLQPPDEPVDDVI